MTCCGKNRPIDQNEAMRIAQNYWLAREAKDVKPTRAVFTNGLWYVLPPDLSKGPQGIRTVVVTETGTVVDPAEYGMDENDALALRKWKERYTDSVFGIPDFRQVHYPRGWYSEHLKDYSGLVYVESKRALPTAFQGVKVYVTSEGFTDPQRQFYLRLSHDLTGVIRQILPSVEAAFRRDFPQQGTFPESPRLLGAELGKSSDGKLESAVLTFEYDQDAYVDVVLSGDSVTSVSFYE